MHSFIAVSRENANMERNYYLAQDDIRKAMKGSKSAMLALFSEHGSKVVCLCRSLLLDENESNAPALSAAVLRLSI